MASNLNYLRLIKQKVTKLLEAGKSAESLQTITIESCGKSRIPLNGLVTDLHQANLLRLYNDLAANGG